MRFKFFTLIAAAVLLAACASEPEESATTTTTGGTVGSGSGTSASTTALPSLDPRSQEWLVVNVGDRVIIANYATLAPAEISGHQARVVQLDEHNRVTTARNASIGEP